VVASSLLGYDFSFVGCRYSVHIGSRALARRESRSKDVDVSGLAHEQATGRQIAP